MMATTDQNSHIIPLAAFGNPIYDFFSARIGCQASGFCDINLAALCVRRNAHR